MRTEGARTTVEAQQPAVAGDAAMLAVNQSRLILDANGMHKWSKRGKEMAVRGSRIVSFPHPGFMETAVERPGRRGQKIDDMVRWTQQNK